MTEPAYKLPRETDGQRWPAQGKWTYEDYLRLPEDGNRYEVIRGVLYVTPAPKKPHQFTVVRLCRFFDVFVSDSDYGIVLTAPYDVRLPLGISNPVQPDVIVFRKENDEVPDLVVEVLSPSTRRLDETVKLKAYQDAGVSEYWLVDPNTRTVVVYVLENGKYVELVRGGAGEAVWSSILPGFRVDVTDLFMS